MAPVHIATTNCSVHCVEAKTCMLGWGTFVHLRIPDNVINDILEFDPVFVAAPFWLHVISALVSRNGRAKFSSLGASRGTREIGPNHPCPHRLVCRIDRTSYCSI